MKPQRLQERSGSTSSQPSFPNSLVGRRTGDRPTSSSLKAASYGCTINGTEILAFTVAGIDALREIISYQPAKPVDRPTQI
jgi:hypothetical protein